MNTKNPHNPIRTLRESLDLTQEQFAARLSHHLTGSAVSRWESGRRIPGAYYMERLEAVQRGDPGVPVGPVPPRGGAERRTPRYPKKTAKAKKPGRPRGSEDWTPRQRRPT